MTFLTTCWGEAHGLSMASGGAVGRRGGATPQRSLRSAKGLD